MLDNLFNQNIWWQDRGLIEHDPKIREFNARRIKWRPGVIDEFDLNQFAIYTLRGPRQVGKTTALKLLIRDLLNRRHISTEQVMYYSCDNIDNYRELIELLETYLAHIKKLRIERKRLYIFLDEVTSIRDWQRGIKHLVDTGRLSRAVMILTGSNATDLRKGMERLPGRRGKVRNPDRVFLPLRFREFIKLTDPELHEKLGKGIDIFRDDGWDLAGLAGLMPFLKELSIHLDRYLITGGFIRAINEYFSENEIGYAVYEMYQQWLRGDISRAGRSERTARQIIAELLRISVSAFGWETVARKIDVATHKTVSEYIEEMEETFVLKTLYQIDLNTLMPRVKKMKKVYFLDSFIYWTLRGWVENWLVYSDNISRALLSPALKAELAELVVANELFSRFDRLDWLNSNIFFWKNGGEIDFMVKKERDLLPVEVKYRRNLSASVFRTMKRLGFKRGIIVSMDRLEISDGFLILPLEIFLVT